MEMSGQVRAPATGRTPVLIEQVADWAAGPALTFCGGWGGGNCFSLPGFEPFPVRSLVAVSTSYPGSQHLYTYTELVFINPAIH
jgi:hypothetical protein